MNQKKTTCFRDEIRKSLIYHALAPCILSLTVLVLAFMVIGFEQIKGKSQKSSAEYSESLERLMNEYIDKNRGLCQDLNIPDFLANPSYKVDAVSGICRFLNKEKIKGDYYLFDFNKKSIFSTQNDQSMIHYMEQCHLWGMSEWAEGEKKEVIFTYGRNNWGGRAEPAWVIFRPVRMEGKVLGYSGFVLPADRFSSRLLGQELTILVTNRFNRVFTQDAFRFQDERGKLREEFQRRKALIQFEERYYYVADNWILDRTIRVMSVYDCTSFVQLCLMAVLSVAVLALVMVFAIYRSAKAVAGKKTEILYELTDALGQVEKGDLNVFLNITTGDEFEEIGNSFHMMLGSLRHLIARHRELARENMLSTVQMLEAQFNPHFLFNTLESIRYLIKFEPKDAERMIVSLSKLLRYSIQNGRDKVELREELKFIDRYLQIMLYRHGERLNYRIDADGCDDEILVPCKILQPVVENSIKYGFGEDKDELNITIRVVEQEQDLLLMVEDDGIGIHDALIKELTELFEQRQNQTEHIGLYNVDRRIKLTYGTKKGVGIQRRRGGGTVVSMRIPKEAQKMAEVFDNVAEDSDSRG